MVSLSSYTNQVIKGVIDFLRVCILVHSEYFPLFFYSRRKCFLLSAKLKNSNITHIHVKGNSLYNEIPWLLSPALSTPLITSPRPSLRRLWVSAQQHRSHIPVRITSNRESGGRGACSAFADLILTGKYFADFRLSQTKQCLTFKF